MSKSIGTVKWYNEIKGFGFIVPEEGNNDVFVHVTALQDAGIRSLAEGQKVAFNITENKQGKKAAADLEEV